MKNKIIRITNYLKEAFITFNNNNVHMLPANIAFFTLWSIIPLVILWDIIEKFIPRIIGENISKSQSLTEIIDIGAFDYSLGEGSIFLLLLIIYLSSKPFMSIISASNYIYKIDDNSYIKTKLKSIVLSILLMFTIMVLLIIPVLGEKIVNLVESSFTSVKIVDEAKIFKWPLTLIYLFVVITIIYSFSPNKKIKVKYFLPGTVFVTICWLSATYAYAFYVNNLANYHKIYSSFTSVIILMIWIYLISYVLVIGLVINAAYFREKNNVETVG
ncbi:MAG: YihY/virulence factor BrkB family protein [Bacilli bacterium]